MKKRSIYMALIAILICSVFSMVACNGPEDITGEWIFFLKDHAYPMTMDKNADPILSKSGYTCDQLIINKDGTAIAKNSQNGKTTQYTWEWDNENEYWVFVSDSDRAIARISEYDGVKEFTMAKNETDDLRLPWNRSK